MLGVRGLGGSGIAASLLVAARLECVQSRLAELDVDLRGAEGRAEGRRWRQGQKLGRRWEGRAEGRRWLQGRAKVFAGSRQVEALCARHGGSLGVG